MVGYTVLQRGHSYENFILANFEKFIALKKKDIMTEQMDIDNISKTSADYYTDR